MKWLVVLLLLVSCSFVKPIEEYKSEMIHVDGRMVVLDSAPVSVCMEPAIEEMTHLAMNRWNQWLGARVFKSGCEDADVFVVYRPNNGPWNGITYFLKGNKRLVVMHRAIGATLVHELGHTLGLDHDPDNPYSIMYPNSLNRVAGELEPKDRAILREIYVK